MNAIQIVEREVSCFDPTLMANFIPFQLCAFGCQIQATAFSEDAYETLQQYIFPSIPRSTNAGAAPDLRIRIEKVESQFRLFVNDSQVSASGELMSLVPDFIQRIDETIVGSLNTLRAVHAGAVRLGDRVLLLPGSSHWGKSRMVAELLRRGANYFSDEYALIDDEGRVHAYPRPLLLRNGSPNRIPVLVQEHRIQEASAAAPVGWIMELQYQADCAWHVSTVGQGEGLLMLLRHTPHVLAEAPDLLGKFQRAAAGAKCFAGRRMDAGTAVDEILRLIEE